jgi:putative hydrolase of HD superfamily
MEGRPQETRRLGSGYETEGRRNVMEIESNNEEENREKHQAEAARSRLEKQMDFLLEMDKSKEIIRQTYLSDGSRKEDDAEHAWHMALMAMLLCEYANEPVDKTRVIEMALVHDLVEVDAGDTYAYDKAGNATKREREVKAAERIFNLLPEDQAAYLRGLWDEFEAGKTPEAKFTNTLDKVQPILLTNAAHGKSWLEHHVKEQDILDRNKATGDGSRTLWDYFRHILDENVEAGLIILEKEG